VPAAVKALKVLRARFSREAIRTESVRRHMQAVCLGIQLLERDVIAALALDTAELVDDGAAELRRPMR
jgi:hypothetical protein